jgi:hypothetical protein
VYNESYGETSVRNLTLISILAVAGGAGCPFEGGPPPLDPDAMSIPGGEVELGTGALEFEPLVNEQELGLVAGPQGGYHFIVHARIRDMVPGDPNEPVTTPSTRFYVYTEAGEQIDMMTPAYRIAYDDTGDGWFALPGGRTCRVENASVPAIYGQRVRIRVVVRDEQGHTAQDERWVLVFDQCERYPEDCQFG